MINLHAASSDRRCWTPRACSLSRARRQRMHSLCRFSVCHQVASAALHISSTRIRSLQHPAAQAGGSHSCVCHIFEQSLHAAGAAAELDGAAGQAADGGRCTAAMPAGVGTPGAGVCAAGRATAHAVRVPHICAGGCLSHGVCHACVNSHAFNAFTARASIDGDRHDIFFCTHRNVASTCACRHHRTGRRSCMPSPQHRPGLRCPSSLPAWRSGCTAFSTTLLKLLTGPQCTAGCAAPSLLMGMKVLPECYKPSALLWSSCTVCKSAA